MLREAKRCGHPAEAVMIDTSERPDVCPGEAGTAELLLEQEGIDRPLPAVTSAGTIPTPSRCRTASKPSGSSTGSTLVARLTTSSSRCESAVPSTAPRSAARSSG